MSDTKIVIDKEQKNGIVNKMLQKIIDTLPVKPVFEGDVLIALHDELLDVLTQNATEIQIDQSIEEKIKSILNKYEPINKGTEYFYNSNSVIESMQEIATSQQIIEQLRVKEKDKECKHCGKIRNKHTVIGMCLDRMKHFEI